MTHRITQAITHMLVFEERDSQSEGTSSSIISCAFSRTNGAFSFGTLMLDSAVSLVGVVPCCEPKVLVKLENIRNKWEGRGEVTGELDEMLV